MNGRYPELFHADSEFARQYENDDKKAKAEVGGAGKASSCVIS